MGAIRFRLFGFPVQIQLGFWLLALIIGVRPDRPWTDAVIWLGVILVSVLVHELGHAFAARRYGQDPIIVLHMFGGLTSWRSNEELGRKRRVLVTLAGPGAGFALAILAYIALVGATHFSGGAKETQPIWIEAIALLAFANVFWSVINLLPVLPFDGGQVLATALGPQRIKLSATVSLVFGLIAAFVLYRMGSMLGALLFAMGGVSNFLSAMQAPKAEAELPTEAAGEILAEAARLLSAGEHERAGTLAAMAVEAARSPAELKKALELVGWARLLSGDAAGARNVLRSAREPLDPYLQAAVADADGDRELALGLLESARKGGDARVEVAAMLVRLLLEAGRGGEAGRLALEIADQIPDQDLERLASTLDEQGQAETASELRGLLAVRKPEA